MEYHLQASVHSNKTVEAKIPLTFEAIDTSVATFQTFNVTGEDTLCCLVACCVKSKGPVELQLNLPTLIHVNTPCVMPPTVIRMPTFLANGGQLSKCTLRMELRTARMRRSGGNAHSKSFSFRLVALPLLDSVLGPQQTSTPPPPLLYPSSQPFFPPAHHDRDFIPLARLEFPLASARQLESPAGGCAVECEAVTVNVDNVSCVDMSSHPVQQSSFFYISLHYGSRTMLTFQQPVALVGRYPGLDKLETSPALVPAAQVSAMVVEPTAALAYPPPANVSEVAPSAPAAYSTANKLSRKTSII